MSIEATDGALKVMSKHTPLYDVHVDAGGKMVDFAGYSLPVHYGSLVNEHHAVRQTAGVFDVSHMTIVDVSGDESMPWLRKLLSNDVRKLAQGKALYSCLCNEQGGVIDDLIVYCMGDNDYRLIVNAATREKDLAWFEKHRSGDVKIDVIDNLALLAVQGPTAVENAAGVLTARGLNGDAVKALKRFTAWRSDDWFIARTGYTGEDGLEIALPASAAAEFWQALVNAGVTPAGLGARDTLRLEAGMSLYGNDLDEDHSPAESGIAWTIDLEDDERDFIGRETLEDHKLFGGRSVMLGLTLDGRGVLRQGQTVERVGKAIGTITSGTFSPTLQKTIALARVDKKFDGGCDVIIRDKLHAAHVVDVPFLNENS